MEVKRICAWDGKIPGWIHLFISLKALVCNMRGSEQLIPAKRHIQKLKVFHPRHIWQ